MQLRFLRSQDYAMFGRIRFRLTAEAVLSDEEKFVLDKYNFRGAALVLEDTPELLKRSVRTGLIVAAIIGVILYYFVNLIYLYIPYPGFNVTYLATFIVFVLATYIHYRRYRQNIYVYDLLRGRTFKCKSIIELAQKEAYLHVICDFFRQVLETAQNWSGWETIDIEPMSPEEAKAAVIRGL